VDLNFLFVNILNGVVYGSFLLLTSLGLSLVFGLGRVVNFAHGALYAMGGYALIAVMHAGGAGYWLANDARDFKLAYGGIVVGWQSPEFGRIRFGGRGLAGAGRATLGFDVTPLRGGIVEGFAGARPGDIRFGVTDPRVQTTAPTRAPLPSQPQTFRTRVIARDDFLVFEPQANISARITKAIGVSCGIGYRETAQADILRDRLNGPTASLAVQFGW